MISLTKKKRLKLKVLKCEMNDQILFLRFTDLHTNTHRALFVFAEACLTNSLPHVFKFEHKYAQSVKTRYGFTQF